MSGIPSSFSQCRLCQSKSVLKEFSILQLFFPSHFGFKGLPMSVADLDSTPSHASAEDSDPDNEQLHASQKDLFDVKSMHSAVSKMPSVVSVDHSSSQSTGYQTPDRTYALKALRSSAGLGVEPATESTRKMKEDLSEKYLKELLESLVILQNLENSTKICENLQKI